MGTRPSLSVAVVAMVAAGVALGSWRATAVAPPPVKPGFVQPAARFSLTEAPRPERFGWRAMGDSDGRRLLLRGPGRVPRWSTGEVLRVRGTVRPLREDESWLALRRVSGVVNAGEAAVVGRRTGAAGLIDGIRRRADEGISIGLDSRSASLLRGMVLGDDSSMAPSLRDRMRKVGLGHIVAASGANVAILLALVLVACALVGAGFRARIAASASAIALYALLCGGGPSILRASISGGAMLAALLASRPVSRWQALALAAAVTLAIDPQSWKEVGWQLSYAAVIGITLLASPARDAFARCRVPPGIAEAAGMTLAATVATAPVSAAAFGVLSPVSLPVNVLVSPLVAPATWLGMAAGAVAQLDARLAVPLTSLARWPLAGILAVTDLSSRLAFAQVAAGPVVATALALAAAGAVIAFASPARRRLGAATLAVSLLVLGGWLALRPHRGPGAPPGGGTRISFLDVGQGDATLFQSRGHALLVDAGRSGAGAAGALQEAGVTRLDALLVTHAQADHLGGAAEVLRRFDTGLLIDGRSGVSEPAGREMASVASARGVQVVAPRSGDRFRVGRLTAEVLWPDSGDAGGGDPNLRCVVLRVTGPGLRMLLGGDAESEVLSPLHPGPADLMKVSHHGSADPGLPKLLSEVRPALAVIEVGARNPYGHPARSTLASLARAGARVLRTDRDGTVRVDVTASGLRVMGRP